MNININGFDYEIKSSFGLKAVLSILHNKSMSAFNRGDKDLGNELLKRCFDIEKEYNKLYEQSKK